MKLAEAALSQARGQYDNGDRDAAWETIKSLLRNRHAGPEAQLLYARILADDRRFEEALSVLKNLVNERADIAGAAHLLWGRILGESGPLNPDKFKQIEEYRQKAEALLPKTAEAFYLRAMMALTVPEQLEALEQALRLNSKHYESLRLRAYTWYASRKYDRMNEDARAMETLHDSDPLAHSLRATALRELDRCQDAIGEYDQALERTARNSPQRVELSVQRCDTLLRMKDYDRIIAEVQPGAKDVPVLQNHLFGAWTAVGDYDKASRRVSSGL